MEIFFKEAVKHVLGPNGGLFASGVIIGAYSLFRFFFPKWLQNEIKALQVETKALREQVQKLEAELEPYKEWQNAKMKEALNARKS